MIWHDPVAVPLLPDRLALQLRVPSLTVTVPDGAATPAPVYLPATCTAMVIGCGAVGLSAVQGCVLAGCGEIIAVDPSPARRQLAQAIGATIAIAPDEAVDRARALTGGRGTIIGGLLGVLILGVLNNGMILTSVPTFYQMVARGVLLVAAVVIAEHQGRRYA